MVQWLGLRAFTVAFTAKGTGSISGWGTKIPQATRCSQKRILAFILNALMHGRPVKELQARKDQLYIFKGYPACGLNNLLLQSNIEEDGLPWWSSG